MDQLSTQTNFEFAGFRLDTVLQVLVSPAGEAIPLPARAYDALRYLVERPGELVDKAELMRAIWPNTLVEENNLNQCILTLRRALGETAGERRFILTIPGRGFKFVAPVRVVPAQLAPQALALPPQVAEPAQAAPPRAPVTPKTSWRRPVWKVVGIAALLAAAGGAALLVIRPRSQPVTVATEYEALTELSESALAPALSPDGKMLAFIGDAQYGWLGSGRVYVKQLPHGQAVALTGMLDPIGSPTFSFDGSRVTFTWLNNNGPDPSWVTWTIPTTGGQPTPFLSNAASLSWIGPHELLYAETKSGLRMGIVTSSDERAGQREIYAPEHASAKAYTSSLSPDRRSVLVTEIGSTGEWQQCRLVPFDGSSPGRQVGPAGSCIAAAWSPDGRWMYFSAGVAGTLHLWRQRYPDGQPQQITFGPTEEVGVAVAPDGRSLITSLGLQRQSIWLHDASGNRRITSEAVAAEPWLSADAKRLYYVTGHSPTEPATLWRLDIASGQQAPLLASQNLLDFDLSHDEREVVYTLDKDGDHQIWVAPLDRHLPPRLLTGAADQPTFGAGKQVFFRRLGAQENFLFRMQDDGTGQQRVLTRPIREFNALTPDATRAVVFGVIDGKPTTAVVDLATQQILWSRVGGWPVCWSPDGRRVYLQTEEPSSGKDGASLLVSSSDGTTPLPPRPEDYAAATVVPYTSEGLAPSANPEIYAFPRRAWVGNIYRIPLHR